MKATKNRQLNWREELSWVKEQMQLFADIGVILYFNGTIRVTFCSRDNPHIVLLTWKTKERRGYMEISKDQWAPLCEEEKREVIEQAKQRFLELVDLLKNLQRIVENRSDKAANVSSKSRTLVFDGDNSWIEMSPTI